MTSFRVWLYKERKKEGDRKREREREREGGGREGREEI